MSSNEGYSAIAQVYDKLNKDIDYNAWADFFEKCFERFLKEKPQIVLDLACGTGRMTREMAQRGYDMIGVDRSVDMLGEAYSAGEAPSTRMGRLMPSLRSQMASSRQATAR